MNEEIDSLYLGAGCFWNAERVYSQLEGVVDTEVGWCTYDAEGFDRDGRVEVVRVRYDTTLTSVDQLVEYFWDTHNPRSEKNSDEFYVERSMLLANDPSQLEELRDLLREKKRNDSRILTGLASVKEYQRAPDNDQKYYLKN